mgnify:CR=1 FL=1
MSASTDKNAKYEIKSIDEKCLGVDLERAKEPCKRIVRFDGEPITNFPSMPESQVADNNTLEDYRCAAYVNPSAKWRLSDCPLASHLTPVDTSERGKKRVGQQKQKKRR